MGARSERPVRGRCRRIRGRLEGGDAETFGIRPREAAVDRLNQAVYSVNMYRFFTHTADPARISAHAA